MNQLNYSYDKVERELGGRGELGEEEEEGGEKCPHMLRSDHRELK